jgi:hypothetical protein
VRASIGNDFNAALKEILEDLLQVAASNSETYMNEFHDLREQNQELRRQMSLRFNNLEN